MHSQPTSEGETPERTPLEDILIGGLIDWADASWATTSARLLGVDAPHALRDSTLALIAEVLGEGLMVAGDVEAGRHVPWGLSVEEAMERIRREWLDEWGDEIPTPGAIVWLSNTSKGDGFARSVLERESRS